MGEYHLIEVACLCDDIEYCSMERYISDVRILLAEINATLDNFDAEHHP